MPGYLTPSQPVLNAFTPTGNISATTIADAIVELDSEKIAYNNRSISSNATAVNNDQIFADTTSSSFTITLPLTPSVGNTISIVDAAGKFGTNKLIVDPLTKRIESKNEVLYLDVNNASITLFYVSDTIGWKVI
jgi:hypothetical protein